MYIYSVINKLAASQKQNRQIINHKMKKLNNFFYIYSLISFFSYILIIWIFILAANQTNIDNSGMGLIIFCFPLLCTVILSIVCYFNSRSIRKEVVISDGVNILMIILSVPTFLFNGLILFLIFTWSIT